MRPSGRISSVLKSCRANYLVRQSPRFPPQGGLHDEKNPYHQHWRHPGLRKKETGLTPGLSGEEILSAVHLVTRDVELAIEDLFQVDNANIFPENWRTLAEKIDEACGKYQGVVVLHGTDTMAYTASMLSFMLQNIPIPVVVTGSQLSISHPVADAMENS